MTRDACNLCGGETLAPVLDLGALPLPNNLYAEADASTAAPRYPLTLATCEACGLAQLLDAVPPAEMFRFYRYTPSASAVLTDHFRRLASTARRRLRLMPDERVVDIGSNDGLLLRLFRDVCGSDVMGVDPAENLARTANESGVRTLNAFWEDVPAAAAGPARLVVSTNCLGHTSRLAEFLSGVHDALAPGGHFLFEVPYLADLVAATWETRPQVIELFPRPRVAPAPAPRARLLEAATL
jgi:SAM-dependent methyltransferase